MFTRLAFLLSLSILFVPAVSAAEVRELTFEERVVAQRAIDRVYYVHQDGARRSFEEAVPRAASERKVRAYLEKTVALDRFWNTPITGEALEHELARISCDSQLPGRLREIFSALGNDPALILECFARPALVNRLAGSFFESDQRIHLEKRLEADELRTRLSNGERDMSPDHHLRKLAVVRTEPGAPGESDGRANDAGVESLALSAKDYERWRARIPVGGVGAVEDEGTSFVVRVLVEEEANRAVVQEYRVAKRDWSSWWAGSGRALGAGAGPDELALPGSDPSRGASSLIETTALMGGPCPADDVWEYGLLDDDPERSTRHTAVWTGSQMLVWGGFDEALQIVEQMGRRYDPLTNTWTSISSFNAPSARSGHTAVWTGTEMIVWGGSSNTGGHNTGGRYDPISDSWTAVSTVNAPTGRGSHTAVWTGTEMIVWGGEGVSLFDTGGRYEPSSNTWTATSPAGIPARRNHTAVWTGSRMIVWGGRIAGSAVTNTGASYDPGGDTWTALPTIAAPTARERHSAVWTGTEMILWGGVAGTTFFNSGARYALPGICGRPPRRPAPRGALRSRRRLDGQPDADLEWLAQRAVVQWQALRPGHGHLERDVDGQRSHAAPWPLGSLDRKPAPRVRR